MTRARDARRGAGAEPPAAAEHLPPPRDIEVTKIELEGVEFLILEHGVRDVKLPEALTNAERRIVPLLARGLSSADIALACGVRKRTVDNQLASIYQKLQVGSREALLAQLVR